MFLNAPFIFRIGSVQQTLDFERAEDWIQAISNGSPLALAYSPSINLPEQRLSLTIQMSSLKGSCEYWPLRLPPK